MPLTNVHTGRRQRPPRLFIYGIEGIGKSSLAASAPNPIFLPTEDGLDEIVMHVGEAQFKRSYNLAVGRGDIDAAWTVEPWVTRLTEEFGGEILVEKKEAPITLLVTSVSALGRRRAGTSGRVPSAWYGQTAHPM